MIRRFSLALGTIAIIASHARASPPHRSSILFRTVENPAPDSTQIPVLNPDSIRYGRLALVGGTLLSSMAAIHIYQQTGWWKDNRAPFHFQEDLVYGLSVDKIGHFYGAYLLGFVIGKSLEWANVPERTAIYAGSGGSLLFQTYVEIEDGFSA